MATKTGAIISSTVAWVKEVRKNKIIAAILLLIQGILFIIKPQSGPEKVARSVAIFVLVGCTVYLVEFLAAKDKEKRSKLRVALAAVVAVAAIVVAAKPGLVSKIVIYAIAVLAIINGIVNLIQAFKLNRKVDGSKIAGIIINVLTVGFGIALLFTGRNGSDMMTRIVGVVLVFNAASDLWTCLQMHMALKNS